MIQLRSYQIEAIEAIEEARKRACNRQLIVLPTGTGKTILFAALAHKMNTRTLILAHREELLYQAADKIRMLWKEADIGILKAERDEVESHIVIASVQTAIQPKRLARLREQGFSLLIVDEAHHATANTYKRIFEELGFHEAGGKLLIGVTATAKRGDGQALGTVFDEIVFERSISTMIKAGYLSDVRGIRIQTKIDLSSVETRTGDFNERQLAAVVNTEARNKLIVDSYSEHTRDKKAIVFTVNVEHAKSLSEAFKKSGIETAVIYGDMSSEERKTVLQAFSAGRLKVLTSCNVLTEGFDEPGIEAILMARPTKSQSLYIQCIGRGLRLHPGKVCCTVLDFTDSRQDVMQMATLVGKPIEGKSFREVIKEDKTGQREKPIETQGEIELIKAEHFDLVGKSVYRWISFPSGHYKLGLGFQEYIFLKQEAPEQYKVGFVKGSDVEILSSQLLPLSYAQGVAEDRARQLSRTISMKTARWYKGTATAGQISYMKRLGINAIPKKLTKGQASDMIEQKLAEQKAAPASPHQIRKLLELGIEVPPRLNKSKASSLISKAINGGHSK